MILVIRISGQVDLAREVNEALFRLRLRKKYTAVLVHDTEKIRVFLSKLRDFIAYGPIDKETLKLLVEKRGQLADKTKKADMKKIIDELGAKSLAELGLKPFFRLHPPRGGIDSKKHAGVNKGVLGDNKEKINQLVRRML